MFNNSKYGNLLTVVLIIAIIAIIAIAGVIGYRIYKAYYLDKGAIEAADTFETTIDDTNKENNIADGSSSIEGANEASSFDTEKLQSKTKYKGYDVIATIQVPTINLKYPILEELTKKSLETSVVLLYTANGINKVGNTVIIGHNYRNRNYVF